MLMKMRENTLLMISLRKLNAKITRSSLRLDLGLNCIKLFLKIRFKRPSLRDRVNLRFRFSLKKYIEIMIFINR